MYEILKQLCDLEKWDFIYGRRDFQNLYDDLEKKLIPYIFCDPIKIDEIFDDYGNVEKTIFSGSFIICMSSDIDEESYVFRYENYIKPLLDVANEKIKTFIKCNKFAPKLKKWSIVEAINLFDYNLDGLIITFNLEIE